MDALTTKPEKLILPMSRNFKKIWKELMSSQGRICNSATREWKPVTMLTAQRTCLIKESWFGFTILARGRVLKSSYDSLTYCLLCGTHCSSSLSACWVLFISVLQPPLQLFRILWIHLSFSILHLGFLYSTTTFLFLKTETHYADATTIII